MTCGEVETPPDPRYRGNTSRFHVVSESLEEENKFNLKALRTGVRSGILSSISNLVKGALGGGLLMGHVAYMTAGAVPGVMLTCFYGFHMWINFYTLGTCAQKLCRRARVPSMTYPDVGEAAVALFPNPSVARWSKWFRLYIEIIACSYLFMVCVAYQLFVASTLKQFFENSQAHTFKGILGWPNLQVYVAAMIVPTILICLITEIRYLTPFSIGGNVTIVVALGTTVYFAMERNPKLITLLQKTYIEDLFQFTTISALTLSCTAVVMPVENNMKDPNKFWIVIFVGYMIITGMVLLTSYFAYAACEDLCEGAITDNFPLTLFPRILKGAIALMICITHALNFFMPFQIVFYYLSKKTPEQKIFMKELKYRAFIVLSISILAIIFASKNYGQLVYHGIALMGAFCVGNLAFVCPNLIYVLVHYDRPGLGFCVWRVWTALLLTLLGVYIFVGQSVHSCMAIMDYLEIPLSPVTLESRTLPPTTNAHFPPEFWTRRVDDAMPVTFPPWYSAEATEAPRDIRNDLHYRHYDY